jgi:hypothetical protein
MAVSWDVAPCSLVDIDRRFREAYYLHHQDALMMEAVSNISEDRHLHTVAARP